MLCTQTLRASQTPHARRTGDAQGLEVSPCSLLQDDLIQAEIGYGLPQASILFLKILKTLGLTDLQAAKLLAPTVVGDDLPPLVGVQMLAPFLDRFQGGRSNSYKIAA